MFLNHLSLNKINIVLKKAIYYYDTKSLSKDDSIYALKVLCIILFTNNILSN